MCLSRFRSTLFRPLPMVMASFYAVRFRECAKIPLDVRCFKIQT